MHKQTLKVPRPAPNVLFVVEAGSTMLEVVVCHIGSITHRRFLIVPLGCASPYSYWGPTRLRLVTPPAYSLVRPSAFSFSTSGRKMLEGVCFL